MKTRTIYRKPTCFKRMYELGEDHMASNCLGCPLFNKCSEIGGGVETSGTMIPRQEDSYGELECKW